MQGLGRGSISDYTCYQQATSSCLDGLNHQDTQLFWRLRKDNPLKNKTCLVWMVYKTGYFPGFIDLAVFVVNQWQYLNGKPVDTDAAVMTQWAEVKGPK